MKKPSKKQIIISVGAVAVLALTAFGGYQYGLSQENHDATAVPDNKRTSALQESEPLKLEETIPEGTLSPTAIVKAASEYKDKDVKVRGVVVKTKDGNYLITGQERENPGALRIYTDGSNIDIQKYANYAPGEGESSAGQTVNAKTATGKISVKDGVLALNATSIE